MNIAAKLAAIGTATIGEAWSKCRIMQSPLAPICPEMTMAGFAVTVKCCPGDNLAIHHAIALTEHDASSLLVVDYSNSTASGPFGEIMAIACQARGINGLLISGSVRDSQQIKVLNFPVFALGQNIVGTSKLDLGQHNCSLNIGGVHIDPGDMIVADVDGIVVIEAKDVDQVLKATDARIAKETEVIERLKAGETTLQVYRLDSQDA